MRHPFRKIPLLVLLALTLSTPSVGSALESRARPKLILVVTVDQLRGDMPLRFKDRFGPGGFRYLMDHGTIFTQAFYRHSTTYTGVGHATLSTGGDSAQHGIAANDWYDAEARQSVYCVEDDQHRVLEREPVAHEGTSPRNLTSTTVGDELVMATNKQSRVFSVSIKDRGAIIPGGHLGKAYWYDTSNGHFITSSFYYREYPEWVNQWNAAGHADRFRQAGWNLLYEKSDYLFGARDDRPFERSYKSLGRTFPHPLNNVEQADYYSTLRFTPMGDELTVDFARELMKQERVAQGPAIDMLCVSLSVTDYIGHAFGPNSLEAEDNLMRLDRTLAQLFAATDLTVGLDHTLVVLSSDHGVSAIPEHLQGLGISSGRLRPARLQAHLNEALSQRFDTDKKLVLALAVPGVYLDPLAIQEEGLDVREVERFVADELLRQPGIAYALTRTDLLADKTSSDPIIAKVQRAFHPQRSGNVMIVQQASWYLYSNPDIFSAMHGSPYPYDTYVPIMFAGPGIDVRTVERLVGPQDVAPTIAALLSIGPPSGCTGKPLLEVLGQQEATDDNGRQDAH